MATRWADSADKHGIDHADALHAMATRVLYVRAFDPSRVPGGQSPDLFIGLDCAGEQLLEVMALVNIAERDVFVFHVMKARRSVIERARAVLAERKAQQ